MRLQITNRKGTTLAELLIYIVLAAMVIVYSLSLITSMAQNYVNTRETSKLQTGSRSTITIMTRDISNMGFKMIEDTISASSHMMQLPGTWTGFFVDTTRQTDSAASFLHFAGIPYDTLEIFKADMINDTTLEGVYRIKYVVSSASRLHRISQKLNIATMKWANPESLVIADNVSVLQFKYTTDGINWHDNPTGIRDQIEEVHIEMLTHGTRPMKTPVNKTFIVGNVVFSTADSSRIHQRWRLYQETVEVPNNGNLL